MAVLSDVLVVNAGSTSLKLSIVGQDAESKPVSSLDAVPANVIAVGHRVVHGGLRFREPVLVDNAVREELVSLAELAPLHNAPAVTAIDAARDKLPALPHVAVFDTAFHATMPAEAATYAVPRSFREQWGIRRYGFHGLSVQWAAEQVPVSRLVVCHLGGGCSVSAVLDGRSVDTTMGFSPLEGVPMATRSGSIDPAALLHLLRHRAATVEELDSALERESGLLGISEISASVEELEHSDAPAARLAMDIYTYRVATAVAAMTAALDGLDALVFTAGVGEHSAVVRERVCLRLGFLGVRLDADANRAAQPDVNVEQVGSPVRIVVLRAREDLSVSRAVRGLLGLPAQALPRRMIEGA